MHPCRSNGAPLAARRKARGAPDEHQPKGSTRDERSETRGGVPNSLGVTLLRIAAAFEIFDGVQVVAAGALRGAGDIHYPFLATLGAHWTIGFPLALLLAFHAGWGAPGLWWGLLVGLVLVAFLLTDRFLRISRGLIKR
ncbi:MAG: hypothetical protein FWD69_19405, partial [Polyangiaceae bacterium]|nr:hypothetical protein [Polyangiaceae bacterium]